LHYLLLLFGVGQHSGPVPLWLRAPRTPIMPGQVTLALIVRELSQVVAALFDFCAFSFCLYECAMGFPDSSCLCFDLIPFASLLS